jgi:hypothetical protein
LCILLKAGPRSKQQGQGGDQYDSPLANQSSNAAYKPPSIYPWVMPMQKPHSCIVTLFFILFITLSSTVAVSTTIYLGMYLSYQGSLVWLSNFELEFSRTVVWKSLPMTKETESTPSYVAFTPEGERLDW